MLTELNRTSKLLDLSEDYFTANATTEIGKIISEFDRLGCVKLESAISDNCVLNIKNFLFSQLSKYEKIFESFFGFSWRDSYSLSNRLVDKDFDFDGMPDDIKHLVRGELPLEVRTSPVLKEVCFEPRFVDVLEGLLGDTYLRMHSPPSVRISQPNVSSSMVPLHQDATYFPHLQNFLTAWVPFTRIDNRCGGIEILSKSHKQEMLPILGSGIWHRSNLSYSQEEICPITCELGDVVLFGPKLLHKSGANSSNRIRCSVDYRFFNHTQPSSKPYYDLHSHEVVWNGA